MYVSQVDFNPRSREGSDFNKYKINPIINISIHAPARGATIIISRSWLILVFQSTLPRGERLLFTNTGHTRHPDFNPRSREGSDDGIQHTVHRESISIHAPARGATAFHTPRESPSQNFNPRSREGSDLFTNAGHTRHTDFNPRSREGSDIMGNNSNHSTSISIHAPARGATYELEKAVNDYIFQSTLPRGERQWY